METLIFQWNYHLSKIPWHYYLIPCARCYTRLAQHQIHAAFASCCPDSAQSAACSA